MSNRPKLPKTYPKGPPGWPVIGNLLQLGSQPHLKLTDWSRQYGAVYSLKLSQKNAVVLNSYQALTEAMVDRKSDFLGRPRDFITWKICSECQNIGFLDYSEVWTSLRKSAHAALRMHGTARWNKIITRQVDKLIEKFSAKESTPFDPNLPLKMVSFNTISELTQSRTFEESDPEFINFAKMSETFFMYLGEASAVDFAAWLKPLFKSKLNGLQEVSTKRYKYMEDKLKERMETLDRAKPNDVVDMLLLAKEDFHKNITPELATKEVYGDAVVIHTLMDFLCAGSETVVSSMKWFLVDMMLHPEIQKKIHQEIDDVVGVDCRPVYTDHDNLPYLKAAIYETMRLHTILPLSVFHRTLCTTSVNGCQIPADTIIIPNHWAIDHDPDVFKDPYVYRPERFIDPNTGRCVSFNEMNFTPFGMGRRVCLGEMLAKMEYFLIAANLLHQFEVSVPVNHGKPSTEGILGLTYDPKHFEILVKRRGF
ncbi:steroid 17-alpha-hydroxylase/17,20 lyase-like [Glandiceps talaboti]